MARPFYYLVKEIDARGRNTQPMKMLYVLYRKGIFKYGSNGGRVLFFDNEVMVDSGRSIDELVRNLKKNNEKIDIDRVFSDNKDRRMGLHIFEYGVEKETLEEFKSVYSLGIPKEFYPLFAYIKLCGILGILGGECLQVRKIIESTDTEKLKDFLAGNGRFSINELRRNYDSGDIEKLIKYFNKK